MNLEGRCALVTGAAQGIGLAIAKRFEEAGAKVISVDIKAGGVGHLMSWDLSDTYRLGSLLDEAEAACGPVDILVNCAGICPTEPMLTSEPATWDQVFKVNVYAPFFLIQEMAKRWTGDRNGVVVNIASDSGFVGKIEQTAYGASKAALVSVTRSAAAALGPQGIRVNAIAPGVVSTPLTDAIAEQRSMMRGISPEATLEPVIQATPLRRIGEPEEVAELALFLASDSSSYITGQTFGVDGGFLMR